MNNKYNNDKYLTTNNDLETYLSRCETCYNATQKATSILYSRDLPEHKLTKSQSKLAIIVNEPNFNHAIGHWLLVLTEKRKNNQALIIDPLANTNEETQGHIYEFCKRNNLSPVFFSIPFQRANSRICGYLTLYMLYCFAHSNMNAIWRMRGSISNTPLRFVEKRMMNKVLKHFNVTI